MVQVKGYRIVRSICGRVRARIITRKNATTSDLGTRDSRCAQVLVDILDVIQDVVNSSTSLRTIEDGTRVTDTQHAGSKVLYEL